MQEVLTPNQVREVAGALRGLVAGLDAEWVTPREAPALFEVFEEVRRLACGAQLLIAHRIEESDAPKDAGVRTAGDWIARVTGQSPTAGNDQVTASKRLKDQPTVSTALRRGELSTNQAQAIADAAASDPESADRLLELARSASLGELRQECARTKAAADPDPDKTYERIHKNRRLRCHTDEEGFWCLNAKGPVDAGAEIDTTLRAITDEIFNAARKTGDYEPREAYLFDALLETARRAWAHMHATQPDTDTDSDDAVGAPRARGRKPGVNPSIRAILRADIEALRRGWVEGEEVCEITGLGPIPVTRARGLLGDAILQLVLTKGQNVATTVHLGRGPKTAQHIALLWQSPDCSRRGCHRPATEYDHRDPFEKVRVTELSNLDGLCDPCHDLKTRHGWALVPGMGKRDMVPPTDPRHPGNPTYHRQPKPQAA